MYQGRSHEERRHDGAGLRVQESSRDQEKGDVKKFQSWYVPIDDTHTMRFQAAFAPFSTHGVPYQWPPEEPFTLPGPENAYFQDYEKYDTISGIPAYGAPGSAIKGFLCQDSMVNESQGPIVNRSLERLGEHDKIIMAMRLMMLKAIADVANGDDPKHVIRSAAENAIVYIRGEEATELV
ncbi:MAG: phthalate 4,5-dioxygenase [Chloroflexi bacterium]|nr:phthalate 4,5-dioxygenase [Chloroflexota bacterium]